MVNSNNINYLSNSIHFTISVSPTTDTQLLILKTHFGGSRSEIIRKAITEFFQKNDVNGTLKLAKTRLGVTP